MSAMVNVKCPMCKWDRWVPAPIRPLSAGFAAIEAHIQMHVGELLAEVCGAEG